MSIYKDDSDEGEKEKEIETRKAASIPKKKAKAPYKSKISGSDNESVDPSFGIQVSEIFFNFLFFSSFVYIIFLLL